MHSEKQKSRFADVIRVFRMVRGFSRMLALSTAIRAASKLSAIALVVILAVFVGAALSGSAGPLAVWVSAAAMLLLLMAALSYLDTYVSHDVSFRIVKTLQDSMYDHMDQIAPGGLEGIHSADSATMILSDINVFEWFVAHCLVEWLGTFAVLIICLLLLCSVSLAAAAAVFLSLVLMMAIPFFSTGQARQKGFLMKRLLGELNGVIADGVSGSKDIIAFHWTRPFFERLDKTANTYARAQCGYTMRSERERTWEAAAACLAILSGLLLAAVGLAEDQTARLLPVFALCVSAVGCIQGTLSESTNFGFVFGAAARMASVLDIEAPVKDAGTQTAREVQAAADAWSLSLERVGFQYPGRNGAPLLKDISFQVNASEVVAIVAASGGGKSTIAKLTQRFWDVDTGAIRVNGTDIRDMTLDALRDIVTVVPQDIYLFHGSIKDNLKLAKPQASDQEIEEAVRLARADVFIHKLEKGLDTAVGENGVALSGGERQRLALAQAFLKEPPILVLDEATSALDTDNEQKINKAIKQHRCGKVTVVIAHRLSSMENADRIIFIKDGSVRETGTYQELLQGCDAFQDLVRGEYLEKENK